VPRKFIEKNGKSGQQLTLFEEKGEDNIVSGGQ
jgi:hypothetical protein